MREWGICIASEKKMRSEARDFAGENLSTKLAPFTFPIKDVRHSIEIRNVPISYTPHLWRKIEDMLEFNDDNSRRYN